MSTRLGLALHDVADAAAHASAFGDTDDGTTVATRVGRWPEAVLVLLAVSVLVTAGLLRRSARRATGDAGSPAETEER